MLQKKYHPEYHLLGFYEFAKCFILYGERGRNRTFNLLIKSQLLCQLSYAPIFMKLKNLDSLLRTSIYHRVEGN